MAKLFISYRRASWSFTYWLVEELRKLLDAEIFVDFTGIDEANFESALLRNLLDSDALLLIVSEHTFEPARILNEKDWVRRELREAIAHNKPIALALYNGMVPPKELPDDIRAVQNAQGIEFYPRYFKAGVKELAAFLDRATPVRLREPIAAPALPLPPVDVPRDDAPKSHKALLDEAISLHESGQYDRAIEVYDQLARAGYRPRILSVEELRAKAVAERDAEQRHWEAGEIYDEIAALFRVDPVRGAAEYARFRADYPEFTSDPAGLSERMAPAAPVAEAVAPPPAPVTTPVAVPRSAPVTAPAPAATGRRFRAIRSLTALKGHGKQINSVAFSPDGRLVASAGGGEILPGDCSIRLWEVAYRKEIGRLEGHTNSVRSIAFSPDGTLLVSGSSDSFVRLWDVANQHEVAALSGHTDFVRAVAYSPDGALVASGSDDKTVRLWDVAAQHEVATLRGHSGWLRGVAFSPDGALLASCAQDNTVRLWDVADQREIALFSSHTNSVHAVAFSPDGTLLASCGDGQPIYLWDVAGRRERGMIETGGGYSVQSLAFSPDGALLASTGLDNHLRLWDVDERREVAARKDHGDWVRCTAFRPDGRMLASGGDDKNLRLWEIEWD